MARPAATTDKEDTGMRRFAVNCNVTAPFLPSETCAARRVLPQSLEDRIVYAEGVIEEHVRLSDGCRSPDSDELSFDLVRLGTMTIQARDCARVSDREMPFSP